MELYRWERFKDARTVHNQHGNQSLSAVATATGISKSKISDLERDYSDGNKKPRDVGAFDITTLARYYGVTTDYLLGLTDDPARKPAATDDLGLSALAVKKIRNIKASSSDDREYMNFLNMFFENPLFNGLIDALYMDCQAVAAETIFSSVLISEPFSAAAVQNRNNKILEIANSKKYNSIISGYLLQMLRFDKEQADLWENNDDFPFDCGFSRDIVTQITERHVNELFDSYSRELCHATNRALSGSLKEEAANGHD